MMLSCYKATFLVSKREEGKLSIKEWIALSLHLSMCKICMAYAKQSILIVKYAAQLESQENLSAEDIMHFKRTIQQSSSNP